MKIVIVVPSLRSGGLERVASILANIWCENHNIFIITLFYSDPYYPLDSKVNVIQPSHLFSKCRLLRIPYLSFWLFKLLFRIKPDSILSFGETYNAFVIIINRLLPFKIRCVVSNRASPYSSLKGLRGTLNPYLYSLADLVIIQTSKAMEILKTKYRNTNFKVIGNPVLENSTMLRNYENKIIINIGYMGGNKNQDRLIIIFNNLKNRENWNLHFLGDGPELERNKQIARSLGIGEDVYFFGYKKDVEHFLSNSSIFAFTSTSEGFPNALAEAMSAGCACISYDCVAGPSDIIDNDINGFLIPEGDEALYISKLQLLINDKQLRENFGKAALEKMRMFGAGKIAKEYLNCLTSS